MRGGESAAEGATGGCLGGKLMNGDGILGDLALIREGWKTLERGCHDILVSCGPPPIA
ncbi:hypothetical protein [Streptomyces sp. SID3212]|uniref:hypothetical protein n=1 Tax=Streptomyces sp. SID3212 TaxID=2690259 RepID=UPI00136E863D|nr:hypothetical protein [Streptomyces sp. SID3212]